MQIAEKINRIPQIHYSGAEDRVVPGWVAGNFARAGGNPRCIRPYSVPGAGHMNGWERFWKTHHGTPQVGCAPIRDPSCPLTGCPNDANG